MLGWVFAFWRGKHRSNKLEWMSKRKFQRKVLAFAGVITPNKER